jgi:hypothetical protein
MRVTLRVDYRQRSRASHTIRCLAARFTIRLGLLEAAGRHLDRRKEEPMIELLAVITLAGSALAALPGDWARRRATATETPAQLANAAVVVALIVGLSAAGLVHGLAGVVALVVGLAAGQYAADRYANRRWGSPA